MSIIDGDRFLNELLKDLYKTEEVQKASNGLKDPIKAIEKYVNRQDLLHELMLDPTNSKNGISRKIWLKSLYHDKYVIKENNLPKYSFDNENIIDGQIKSLDKWIDYLSDENNNYPMWAKIWAFKGMLKIGNYNEASGTYSKRNENTTAPFIDINPEVLSKLINNVINKLIECEGNPSKIKDLARNEGNFAKIYPMLLREHFDKMINDGNNEDGIWIKYEYETESEIEDKIKKGITPEYKKLYDSLQGYNTGWCTAESDLTAKDQICGDGVYEGGDFYVYYTKDKNNEYKLPRIAIRMDKEIVGEIRGISDDQNLEEGLEEILEKKLNSMNLCDEDIDYENKRINDMKMLSKINKKTYKKEELTHEELLFIYQVYNEIYGFGWQEDPRIKRIINERDKKEDYKKFDKSEILKFIQRDNNIYTLFEKESINDKDIMLVILKKYGWAFNLASPEIRSDRRIVKYAVSQDGKNLKYASEELQNDKELVIAAVSQDGSSLEYASEELKNNKKVVLLAVNRYGYSLKYASNRLQNNKEVVFAAVKGSGEALKYASERLRNDKEVVSAAVRISGCALAYASERLRNDKEIVERAVWRNGYALKYASEELRNDREVVTTALHRNGEALEYASEELRNDKKIVLTAIKQNKNAIKYTSDDMKSMIELETNTNVVKKKL